MVSPFPLPVAMMPVVRFDGGVGGRGFGRRERELPSAFCEGRKGRGAEWTDTVDVKELLRPDIK